MYSTKVSANANGFRGGKTMRVVSALAVVCALTFASGCSLLSDSLDRAAKGAGKVVTYYCENVTVPEIREEVRAAVNQYAAPHSVTVTCVDGGPTLKTEGEATDPATTTTGVLPESLQYFARAPIIIISKDRKPIIVIGKDSATKRRAA